MAYDEDVIEMERENAAYRARLATAENQIAHLTAANERMRDLLRAARKNIDDVIQYRLVAAIAAELKE